MSIINNLKILVILSTTGILTSYASMPRINIVPKPFNKNWINITYLKCLENKLPCKCAFSTIHPYVIFVDTNLNSEGFEIHYLQTADLEFFGRGLRKEENNKYTIIQKNNELIDTVETFGTILLTNDTLFYFDKNNSVSKFINFGTPPAKNLIESWNVDENKLEIENASMLNKAFINHGYNSLNDILKSDSLFCACIRPLGNLNIIGNNKTFWIVEQNKDSLFIYNYLNPYAELEFPPNIKKSIFKKYLW